MIYAGTTGIPLDAKRERTERMLDRALMEVELYRKAWESERRLKWQLAEILLNVYRDGEV